MTLTTFIRTIPTRVILSIVTLMILVHLVLLSFYTQNSRSSQEVAKRDIAIQNVMNIIHMVSATPENELDHAIASLEIPNVTATLSAAPLYPLHANDLTYWKINRLVPSTTDDIEISLHLKDHRWLNVKAEINCNAFISQLTLIFLELLVTLVLLFYAWSINRFRNPLKHFRLAAERLGIDVNSKPLEEFHGPAVVRETAQAMNRMQKRIQDLLQDRTLLLAAISHDLRTPITRMRLRADKIESPELQHKTILDLNEMESMISEILAFAQNDYTSEKKVKLDLVSLIKSICDDMTDMDCDVTFECDLSKLPYQGRPLTLRRAFTNLIQNAIKYGKCAKVTLARSDTCHVQVIIEDEGPGIAEDQLDKVFAPFYRCDRSRSRHIAGTGLGLSVARNALFAHHGSIKLENREDKGLRVRVIL